MNPLTKEEMLVCFGLIRASPATKAKMLHLEEFFCSWSVKKYPNNPMLGRREVVEGKVCCP